MTPAILRPRKVRSAVRRRWFERRVPDLDVADVDGLVDVGSACGGWTIPLSSVDQDWTCYSVGAGGDISFDLALAASGATVRVIEPVADYVARAQDEARAAVPQRLTFHQVAIAERDAPLRMQVTHDAGSQSVSAAQLYDTRNFVEVPGRTLSSLMAELGDTRIELLKLDIEGAEYAVMPTIDLQALGVRVFSVQLHHTGSVTQARALIQAVCEQGYVVAACRPVIKLTFVRSEGAVPLRSRTTSR